jgi:hypothetical protein
LRVLNESLGNPNVDVGLGNDSHTKRRKTKRREKAGIILPVFAED